MPELPASVVILRTPVDVERRRRRIRNAILGGVALLTAAYVAPSPLGSVADALADLFS